MHAVSHRGQPVPYKWLHGNSKAWRLVVMLNFQTVLQHDCLHQGSCCSSIVVLSHQSARIPTSETQVWDIDHIAGGNGTRGETLGWMQLQSMGNSCPGFAAAIHLTILNVLWITLRSRGANWSERQVSAFGVNLVNLAQCAEHFSWKPSLLGGCSI